MDVARMSTSQTGSRCEPNPRSPTLGTLVGLAEPVIAPPAGIVARAAGSSSRDRIDGLVLQEAR
jgi:hypothetical protein